MPESLADWVTSQAERRPDAVAVVGEVRSLSYAELEGESNRLAAILRDGGCAPGDRVCLLMPKCPEAIVALLGIYKTGCIYVPLDPASPPARLEMIVDSCGPRWILAAGPVGACLEALLDDRPGRDPIPVGWLDEGGPRRGRAAARFTAGDLSRAPAGTPPRRHAR